MTTMNQKDPSAESQNQLSNYAEKGEYDLIIGVGFSMKDSLVAVAKNFLIKNSH